MGIRPITIIIDIIHQLKTIPGVTTPIFIILIPKRSTVRVKEDISDEEEEEDEGDNTHKTLLDCQGLKTPVCIIPMGLLSVGFSEWPSSISWPSDLIPVAAGVFKLLQLGTLSAESSSEPSANSSNQQTGPNSQYTVPNQSITTSPEGIFNSETTEAVRIGACEPVGREDAREDDPTVVRLRISEGRQAWLTFMTDNGAAVNLIKIGSLHPNTLVDTNNVIPLVGISDQLVQTLGTTNITIRGKPIMFLVNQNDFPIKQDGVLGRKYLKQEQAVISYHYNALMIGGDAIHPIPFVDTMNEPFAIRLSEMGHRIQLPEEKIESKEEKKNGERHECLTIGAEASQAEIENVKPETVRYIIPKISRQVIRVNIINKGTQEGYLPLIDVG